jgi:hypothetical protein
VNERYFGVDLQLVMMLSDSQLKKVLSLCRNAAFVVLIMSSTPMEYSQDIALKRISAQ